MRILKKTEAYKPPVGSLKNYFPLNDYELMESALKLNRNGVIIFTPKAAAELDKHILWGKTTPQNIVELMGYMVGRVFYSKENGILIGVCECTVPIDALGNSTYFEATEEQMFDVTEKSKEIAKSLGDDYRIIGWYHTHPGNLSVFMSGTDERNQRALFPLDWHFAVVLNPQKRVWRGFVGSELREVNCIFACGKDSVFLKKYNPKTDKFGNCKKVHFHHKPDYSDYSHKEEDYDKPVFDEKVPNPQDNYQKIVLTDNDAKTLAEMLRDEVSVKISNIKNICINGTGRLVKDDDKISFELYSTESIYFHYNDEAELKKTSSIKLPVAEIKLGLDFTLHIFGESVSDEDYKEFCDNHKNNYNSEKPHIFFAFKITDNKKLLYFIMHDKNTPFEGIIDKKDNRK